MPDRSTSRQQRLEVRGRPLTKLIGSPSYPASSSTKLLSSAGWHALKKATKESRFACTSRRERCTQRLFGHRIMEEASTTAIRTGRSGDRLELRGMTVAMATD